MADPDSNAIIVDKKLESYDLLMQKIKVLEKDKSILERDLIESYSQEILNALKVIKQIHRREIRKIIGRNDIYCMVIDSLHAARKISINPDNGMISLV